MRDKKILIVDDNEVNLKMLKKILTDAGYSLFSANNGTDAIKIALDQIPDLVITDIIMPGIDGGAVANILRNEPATDKIPIFFLSSLITIGEEKCKTKDDVTCLLAKPINREELLKKIREYI